MMQAHGTNSDGGEVGPARASDLRPVVLEIHFSPKMGPSLFCLIGRIRFLATFWDAAQSARTPVMAGANAARGVLPHISSRRHHAIVRQWPYV